MRPLTRLLALMLVWTLGLAAAQAATYHVAPGGDDASPGTAEAPWATVDKANKTLQPGDTVLLHAGSYYHQIRPVRSGTNAGNRITYRAFGDGNVNLKEFGNDSGQLAGGAIALGQRNYIRVDGAAPGDPPGTRWIRAIPLSFVNIYGNVCGGSYNIVENVHMGNSNPTRTGNRGFGFCVNFWDGDHETSYNIFRGNRVVGAANTALPNTEDLITLTKRAHHNLIENNLLEDCQHVTLMIDSPGAHSNVIRHNTIRNRFHTALQVFNAGPNNVIEGNLLEASGGRPQHTTVGPGNALQFSSARNIVRYNVITKGGSTDNQYNSLGGLAIASGGDSPNAAIENRFYNNTIVKNDGTGVFNGWWPNAVALGRSAYVNNVIYGNKTGLNYSGTEQIPFGIRDTWNSNLIGGPNGVHTTPDPTDVVAILPYLGGITAAQTMALTEAPRDPTFVSTLLLDPGFVDYAADDYRLKDGSGLIDAGTHLTVVGTADSGSGTRLKVGDARFFQDGLGIPGVLGDWISIGAPDRMVEILSVDYDNDMLTLAEPVNRSPHQKIWLFRRSDGTPTLRGSAPDVGADEAFVSAGGPGATPPPNVENLKRSDRK